MSWSFSENDRPMTASEEPEGPDQSNVSLFLALYLILLAFFIMLNSSAEISEARARAVAAGVTVRPMVLTDRSDAAMALVADRLEERLTELFDGHRPDEGWRIRTADGVIAVRLPQRKAFGDGSSVLKTTRIAMMQRLAEILGEAQNADGLELSVRVEDAGDAALARRRAAALGRDLVREGIEPARFSLRVVRSEGAGIEFLLRRPEEG